MVINGSNAVGCWCHASSVMATQSNCAHAVLGCGVKESNTHEVSFPDFAPATWESRMKFLEDKPLAGRLMRAKDVMEVAPRVAQPASAISLTGLQAVWSCSQGAQPSQHESGCP